MREPGREVRSAGFGSLRVFRCPRVCGICGIVDMDRGANVAGGQAACRYPFLMQPAASQHEYRPRIATIFLAAFLGGAAAAVGVNRFLDLRREAEHPTVECEPIFVAARGIAAGDPVTVWDVSLKEWPKATAPSDALRIDDSLEGQFAIRTVREGQPLLRSNIARQAARGGPTAIEPTAVEEEEPFDLPVAPRPPQRSTGRPPSHPMASHPVVSRDVQPVDERHVEPVAPAVETPLGNQAAAIVVAEGAPVVVAEGTPMVVAEGTPTASTIAAAEDGSGVRQEPAEAVDPVELKSAILVQPEAGADDLLARNPAADPDSPDASPLSAFAQTAESSQSSEITKASEEPTIGTDRMVPVQAGPVDPTVPEQSTGADQPQPVQDAAASEAAIVSVPAGASSPETVGNDAATPSDMATSPADTATPQTATAPSLVQTPAATAETVLAPDETAASAGGDSASASTATPGGESQPAPLRFLVIPERIAALVDGPIDADAPIATDAPLRTIDPLGPVTQRSRGGAPERSASTNLPGNASLPGNAAAVPSRRVPAAVGGGDALPRQPVTPGRQQSIAPASGRGSNSPRKQPATGPQQPAPGSRPLLRSLFPNVSAGMDRFGHEISERLRRAQE